MPIYDLNPQSSSSAIPTGCILPFAGNGSLPSGYLLCDGSAVSRTTYGDLFAALGTAWGVGNGSTTFNLPSLSRRTLVGNGGTGSATLGNSVGNNGGSENHTLSINEMPAHTHGTSTGGQFIYTTGTGSNVLPITGGTRTFYFNPSTGSTGGDTAHNNMQPSAVIQWIIKF